MERPLVSVICLCYNHARFVEDAIHSVRSQTYRNIQFIIVDDASQDNSAEVISRVVNDNPEIIFISQKVNTGNCRAFNNGLSKAKGEFIIDLAADDILMPDRIEKGVEFFLNQSPNVGVLFSDAEWIDENGSHLYFHSKRFPHHTIPTGDIYIHLIVKYFICSPTMMFRRSVIEYLGGYDETLAYEDFDFWIRSSRVFQYGYSPDVSVKKRVVEGSMSKTQFKNSRQQWSTYAVCCKIMSLNRNPEEKRALGERIRYEIGVNLRMMNLSLVFQYLKLMFLSA
jgi:glycosyltransferase involved in cell wall biosynthesis